jgi:hypothetical protein
VKKVDLTVVASTKRDLAEIEKRDPKLAQSGLAALALKLAEEMDANNSATSKSMCAKSLMETLDRIRALAPAEETEDKVDDLSARRAARRTAS